MLCTVVFRGYFFVLPSVSDIQAINAVDKLIMDSVCLSHLFGGATIQSSVKAELIYSLSIYIIYWQL